MVLNIDESLFPFEILELLLGKKPQKPYEGSIIISILQIRKARLRSTCILVTSGILGLEPGFGLTSVLIIMMCIYSSGSWVAKQNSWESEHITFLQK